MEQDIQKIIEKHLPTQTAGVMKEYIEGAELTEKQLRRSEHELKQAQIKITEFEKKHALYNEMKAMGEDLDLRVQALDDRELMITKRENDRAIAENCIRMEEMQSNMKNMEGLVAKVFGHPSVSITRQVPVDQGHSFNDGSYKSGDALMPATETETKGKA